MTNGNADGFCMLTSEIQKNAEAKQRFLKHFVIEQITL